MANYSLLLVIGYLFVIVIVAEYSPVAGGALAILLALLLWRRAYGE